MKMDPKLLASEENDGSELKTICKRYKVKMKDLRAILLEIGQNGKPERSMDEIKTELENRGYTYHPAKKKSKTLPTPLPEDSTEPDLSQQGLYVNG